MENLSNLFHNLLRDDSGQDMIECSLVAGLIALGAVTTLSSFATDIGTAYTNPAGRKSNMPLPVNCAASVPTIVGCCLVAFVLVSCRTYLLGR